MSKRTIYRLLGLLMLVSLLISFAPAAYGKGPAQEKIKLSLWKAPHNDEAFWRELLPQFTEMHPDIEIEYTVTPWENWTEIYTTAFAGANPPDVFYAPDGFYPRYAHAGQLVKLNEVFPETLEWEELFPSGIWATGKIDDDLYGIPFITNGVSLVWNKRVFEEAGLDPEVPPSTWEEVREYAEKLTQDTDGDGQTDIWGYAIMDNTTGELINFWPSILRNWGASVVNEDRTEWTFDSPEAIEGLTFLADMYQDGLMPPFGTFPGHDINMALGEGKIAMQLSYADMIQTDVLREQPELMEEIGIADHPCGPVNCETVGGVGLWFVSEKSPHKEAAWELVKWLAGPEVVTEFCAFTGFLPSRLDVDPYPDNPFMTAAIPTVKGLMDLGRLPITWYELMSPEVESALMGMKTPEEALTDGAERVREAWKAVLEEEKE